MKKNTFPDEIYFMIALSGKAKYEHRISEEKLYKKICAIVGSNDQNKTKQNLNKSSFITPLIKCTYFSNTKSQKV